MVVDTLSSGTMIDPVSVTQRRAFARCGSGSCPLLNVLREFLLTSVFRIFSR